MLYTVLKRQISKYGLTDALKEKINVLYAAGQLTTAQYEDLMGIEAE